MAHRSTVADWAPHVRTSLSGRLFSFVRSAWMMAVWDGPLAWRLGFYGKNKFEDVEGPFFIVGSPSRAFEDGKGILASQADLEKFGAFLFIMDVKDTKGEPVPHAALDCWQASSAGEYFFASWRLRGKLTADAHGHVEILTVRPGDYVGRAGHLHVKTEGAKGRHVPITTQVYVCTGNNVDHMDSDITNLLWRRRPDENMAACWSTDGEFESFPKVPEDRVDLQDSIRAWNGRLRERGIASEIRGVAQHEYKLTAY